MLTLDVLAQIHDQAHGAALVVAVVIARHRHELDASRDGQAPGKIGEKNERAFENPNENQLTGLRVIPGNFRGQLLHSALDLGLADQNFKIHFRLHELLGQLALHTLDVPIHLLQITVADSGAGDNT